MSGTRETYPLEGAMAYFGWTIPTNEQHEFLFRLVNFLSMEFFKFDEQKQFEIVDDLLDNQRFIYFLERFAELAGIFIEKIIDGNELRYELVEMKRFYLPAALQETMFPIQYFNSTEIYAALLSNLPKDNRKMGREFVIDACKKPTIENSRFLRLFSTSSKALLLEAKDKENLHGIHFKIKAVCDRVPAQPLAEIPQPTSVRA